MNPYAPKELGPEDPDRWILRSGYHGTDYGPFPSKVAAWNFFFAREHREEERKPFERYGWRALKRPTTGLPVQGKG